MKIEQEIKRIGNIVITRSIDCGTPWTIAIQKILKLVEEGKSKGRYGGFTWVVD